MITADALRNQRDLETTDLRLVQNGPQFSDSVLRSLGDQDAIRLTGTHATFNLESVRSYLASLPGRADRADWAVIRKSDGSCIGEAVLNELDADNATMNFRIMLSGDGARERGYGTQTTRAVRDYGFDDVGLNRIGLEVYSFNPRAIRVYDKAGFQREGVELGRCAPRCNRHGHADIRSAALGHARTAFATPPTYAEHNYADRGMT